MGNWIGHLLLWLVFCFEDAWHWVIESRLVWFLVGAAMGVVATRMFWLS